MDNAPELEAKHRYSCAELGKRWTSHVGTYILWAIKLVIMNKCHHLTYSNNPDTLTTSYPLRFISGSAFLNIGAVQDRLS